MRQPSTVPNMSHRNNRHFLVLQGLATPFFAELMECLILAGADVSKVNYCGGDWYFSRKARTRPTFHNFTSSEAYLPEFYSHLISNLKPDAILLFGDCRPIHQTALALASEQQVPVFVFEEGYTRPGHITLERGGTNDRTSLPRSPEALLERASEVKALMTKTESQPELPNPMPARVKMDLQFHAANILGLPFFRGYKTHRPEKVTDELTGWVKGFFRKRKYKEENQVTIKAYETESSPFFLVPLQLNSDYQIREHSPYVGVPEFIKEVLTSFAQSAPKKEKLLFKAHPLDNGMIDYRSLIKALAIEQGCKNQVDYIEGGDLDILLKNCTGSVMINSTVGYAALQHATPTKVLGRAIYNMEGLTDQRPLKDFWQDPTPPQKELVDDFIMVVRHDTQVYGDYFTKLGIKLAAEGAAQRLIKAIQD